MKTLILRVFLSGLLLGGGLHHGAFAAKNDAYAVPDEGASRNTDILRVRGREDGSTTNFVAPGADNTYSLGTDALDWSSVYTEDLDVDDDADIADDITLGGDLTATTGGVNVASVTATAQLLVGSGANISTFTATTAVFDNGINVSATSATVTNQLIVGNGADLSTFTATTAAFDNSINVAVATMTISGAFRLRLDAAPRTNITPGAIGELIVNTGATPDELCFSTGTTVSTWVQVSTPTLACQN